MNDIQDFQDKIEERKSKNKQELITELQLLDTERLRLEQELRSLRKEVDRLREPPLLGAFVVDVKEDNILIMSTLGSFYIYNKNMKINGTELEPGMFVALNQRTSAIIDIFPVSSEQLKKARESLFVTEYIWKVAEEE